MSVFAVMRLTKPTLFTNLPVTCEDRDLPGMPVNLKTKTKLSRQIILQLFSLLLSLHIRVFLAAPPLAAVTLQLQDRVVCTADCLDPRRTVLIYSESRKCCSSSSQNTLSTVQYHEPIKPNCVLCEEHLSETWAGFQSAGEPHKGRAHA